MLKTFETGCWYVLYVRSRQERKIHDFLMENEIESFLPMIKSINQWSDRKKTIYKPLFPSYVFVKINSTKDFHRALTANGACDYIRFGSRYAKVNEREIGNVKLLLQSEEIFDVTTTNEIIERGEVKKINFGLLSGLECEILRINNQNKALVRLDSLHQTVIATIPVSCFRNTSEKILC